MANWEWIKKHLYIPSKICSVLLAVYALFVTFVSGIYATITKGSSLNIFQQIANATINEWLGLLILCGFGILLVLSFFISTTLVYIAKLKLSKSGDRSPCVGTLIEFTKEILQTTLQPTFDITIFKAKDDKELIFFASSANNKKDDQAYPISHTSYDKSWGEIQECWFNNCQAISKDRQNRQKSFRIRSKTYPEYNTVIALAIIPFQDRKTPWGIVRIRTSRQLTEDIIMNIINTTHDNDDGIVNALELLISKQFLCNHFTQYY